MKSLPPKPPCTCLCGKCRKCRVRENTRRYRTRISDEREVPSFAQQIYALEMISSLSIVDANSTRTKIGATL